MNNFCRIFYEQHANLTRFMITTFENSGLKMLLVLFSCAAPYAFYRMLKKLVPLALLRSGHLYSLIIETVRDYGTIQPFLSRQLILLAFILRLR